MPPQSRVKFAQPDGSGGRGAGYGYRVRAGEKLLRLSHSQPLPTMLILFATMTGNAEDAAEQIARRLRNAGHEVTVANIEKFTPAKLATRTDPVLFSVSTWGDGEPPDEALDFWTLLGDSADAALDGLCYSVYALGDSSYDEFCGFGRRLDEMLEKKGAVRIAARAECDCDHEEFIEAWSNDVHAALQDEFAS